jgi:predicted transcriptional regulator
MIGHVRDYKDKYGSMDKMLSPGEVCKEIGICAGTLKTYVKELTAKGSLQEGTHYYLNAAKRYHFTREAIPKFKEIADEKFKLQIGGTA